MKVKFLGFYNGQGNDMALTVGKIYEVIDHKSNGFSPRKGITVVWIKHNQGGDTYVYSDEYEEVGAAIKRNLPSWW